MHLFCGGGSVVTWQRNGSLTPLFERCGYHTWYAVLRDLPRQEPERAAEKEGGWALMLHPSEASTTRTAEGQEEEEEEERTAGRSGSASSAVAAAYRIYNIIALQSWMANTTYTSKHTYKWYRFVGAGRPPLKPLGRRRNAPGILHQTQVGRLLAGLLC